MREPVMGIDEEYIVEVLKELVGIDSVNPPGNEKNIAEKVKDLLGVLDIPCTVQEVGENRANAVGSLEGEGDGPLLVLNGHLDTVPHQGDWHYAPFEGTLEGGRVYGLGSVDMKGGIAAMIAAARAVKQHALPLRGALLLCFVADEERNNAGALKFIEECDRPIDYAVIGEPTNLRIVTSNRGVMRFRIRVGGTAGHASNPAGGVNAIYKMQGVIERLRELAGSFGSAEAAGPSLSVTMIRGGSGENVIPDSCEIVVDRRTAPGRDMEEVEREIGQLLQEIGEEDREFYFTCERFVGLQGWKAREGSRLVEHGVRAYRKCFGEDPQFGDLGATCEAALFAGFGADTVVFGPGSMGRAHTRDEWIEVDHLIRAARFYKTLVEDILVTKDR